MGPTDKRIVAGFLITEQARFFSYLEGIALDETEGAVIIEALLDEIGGAVCLPSWFWQDKAADCPLAFNGYREE